MTLILEIIVPDPKKIGLCEEFAIWGGEPASFDPARYRFGALVFEVHPSADHVRCATTFRTTGNEACLTFPEDALLEWRSGTLGESTRIGLERFFGAVERAGEDWTVVLDTTEGARTTRVECAPAQLFTHVDRWVRHEANEGLVVFFPATTAATSPDARGGRS